MHFDLTFLTLRKYNLSPHPYHHPPSQEDAEQFSAPVPFCVHVFSFGPLSRVCSGPFPLTQAQPKSQLIHITEP